MALRHGLGRGVGALIDVLDGSVAGGADVARLDRVENPCALGDHLVELFGRPMPSRETRTNLRSRRGPPRSMFIVRTPPGIAVELHTHPYLETFLLLEGQGRWTAGEDVIELALDERWRRASRCPRFAREMSA